MVENTIQQKYLQHEPFKDYRIVKSIASGTFGTVYLIRNSSNRQLAVKRVPQNPKINNRELDIMTALSHPNIVRLEGYYFENRPDVTIEQNTQGQYLNLVMEYVQNTLADLIIQTKKANRNLAGSLIKQLGRQLFQVLWYLNCQGICHRDVKSCNILVTQDGTLKLCDFGSAKMLKRGQSSIAYICSRYYRAPELLVGCTEYSTKIDVWAAGCVLAEAMLGRPLFMGENNTDQMMKIVQMLGLPPAKFYQQLRIKQPGGQGSGRTNALICELIKQYPEVDFMLADLMEKAFKFCPSDRITAAEALCHPYFGNA